MSIEVRDAGVGDAPAVAELFYDTIFNVNIRDYSDAQVEAWAGRAPEPRKWEERIAADPSVRQMFVATSDGRVAGFAELEKDGHLDTLFVHHEFQGCGIASRLLDRIETEARGRGLACLYTEASITARPFFETRGFAVVRPQLVEVRGRTFRNFVMTKHLV